MIDDKLQTWVIKEEPEIDGRLDQAFELILQVVHEGKSYHIKNQLSYFQLIQKSQDMQNPRRTGLGDMRRVSVRQGKGFDSNCLGNLKVVKPLVWKDHELYMLRHLKFLNTSSKFSRTQT